MKVLSLLLFVCLSHISYADSDVILSGDLFTAESLQKLYEILESSELPSQPVQSLTSSISQSTVAILNDYADALITQIQSVIVDNGMDTITLPDVNLSFEYKPLLVTYSGLLYLTQGNITSFTSIKRNGDVVASYSNKYLNLEIPLGFDVLNINYHYKAKIMNIGPSGEIIGAVSSTTFEIAIGLNFTNNAFDLNEFTIEDVGDVNLSFKGNSLIDWLLNIITKLLIPLFKSDVQEVLEEDIYNTIVSVLGNFNEVLQSLG